MHVVSLLKGIKPKYVIWLESVSFSAGKCSSSFFIQTNNWWADKILIQWYILRIVYQNLFDSLMIVVSNL